MGIDDSPFITKSHAAGFRWFCVECLPPAEDTIINRQSLTDLKTALVDEVTGVLAAVAGEIGKVHARLDALENKSDTLDTPSFAKILKQTLADSKNEPTKNTTEVVDGGRKRTVRDHHVLVVKPKANISEEADPPDAMALKAALASVPVDRCKKTNSGALVVKFPTKKAKDNASKAIKETLGTNTTLSVTEPKKMLPKMTIVGVTPDISDDEIVSNIVNKNTKIKSLVDEGSAFNLLFTKQKEDAQTKIAVIKMSPEIRSAVLDEGGLVYVGLTRCKAYDRFWVTQCHFCQGFGHNSDNCTRKNEGPKCSFCSGSHESKNCSNKDSPKCINCVKLMSSTDPETPTHFASSRHCPIMISQRNKVIENTNFVSSKN